MYTILPIGSQTSPVFSRAGPTVPELIGPTFLGLLANYLLWGIQITQSYHYYKTYRATDRTGFKVVVGLLFVSDAIQSISATELGWRFMVSKWGDLSGVETDPAWGIWLMPILDTFTASIVHFFYAHKVWVLLDAPYRHIAVTIILSLSCLQLTAGIGCTIFQSIIRMTVSEFNRINTRVGIWLTTASLTDIIITAVMTWKLSKSRTGFQHTDDIISKLIRLTVETGLATAIVQIVDVVVFLIWPLKPYHTFPTFTAPKVYSNSVLAVLNSRPPRNSDKRRESRQLKTADSIGIEPEAGTLQSVPIIHTYELQDSLNPGHKYSSSWGDNSTIAGTGRFTPSPLDHKGHV